MITSLVSLVITIVIVGLLLWVVLYCVETFITPVPAIVRQAIGVIALLLIALYLLRVFGIA